MPLSQPQLASALADLFNSTPATAVEAANGMAQAYLDYSMAGRFGSGAPTLTAAHQAALAGVLLGVIGDPVTASAATLASAWAAGVAAFWLAVPVAGSPSGVTISCAGAASLSGLAAVFGNSANTSESCAQQMAALLHTATLTTAATMATAPTPTVVTIL